MSMLEMLADAKMRGNGDQTQNLRGGHQEKDFGS